MTNYLTMVHGRGTYGNCHVFYSKFTVRDGQRPICVVHHAHTGSADALVYISPGFFSHVEYLARHGYIVVVGDFRLPNTGAGGAAEWGNDWNQVGIADAVSFGIRHGGSSTKKFLLLGYSMGGAICLGFAGRFPQLVAGVIGIIPAIDIERYKNPHPTEGPLNFDGVTPYSFAETIDAAYNGNYTDAAYGMNHNAQYQAENSDVFNNIPIQLWYGDKDTFVPKVLIKRFYDAVKAKKATAPIKMRQIPTPNQVHNDAAVLEVPRQEVLKFARSCVT